MNDLLILETTPKPRGTARAAAILGVAACLIAIAAGGAETDQYLSWSVTLADSAEALNHFVNTETETFLERVNRRTRPITSVTELTTEFYLYFFQGIHSSRIRGWVNRAPEVDRFPDSSVSVFAYQRMSIYRDLTAFPFILPMARTIRVGDVYFGTDKISHFFGFGRRYFQRYLRHRDDGMDEEEAMRRVVLWGVALERKIVGGLVDGIFSHGDLEANFQGFLMARACCEGETAHFRLADGQWRLARPFDLREYITPGFDESYNNSHYTGMRKDRVLEILREEYCPLRSEPEIEARFARYANYPPSFSRRVIADYFAEKDGNPQREQSLDTICVEEALELMPPPSVTQDNPGVSQDG
ncbi:MAG TPA: hypothetical protein PKI11_02980 [Candidatus Hydrogenedentes bacterium]|nr:hypothetical protein [Candidatus Hydrogenedentota bacterium]